MSEVVLGGCRSEPLGSYLKALGVFRLVAEQVDSQARGYWRGVRFVLSSRLNNQEIPDFFLKTYTPTPVIAPWNGRTITALESAKQTDLSAVEHSNERRYIDLQRTIRSARVVLDELRRIGVDPRSKNQADKGMIVRLCRARFPDSAIAWLDAIAVLTTSRVAYPPVTGGAGGVLGSGDLSLNFIEHLRTVIEPTPVSQDSVEGLDSALYGRGGGGFREGMSGQFDPGAAGGANVGQSLVNPWDFILLVEGALLITAGVTRRLGFDHEGEAAFPFTVRSVPVGFGSAADEERTPVEVWMPVWPRPASLEEIRRMFTEGRATWRGAQARTTVDFARAAGALGVDRGIDSFVRYVVGARLGRANLAIPAGLFSVRERHGVPILAQLDRWFESVRRVKSLPTSVATTVREVERALYSASDAPTATNLQDLLRSTAGLEAKVSRSGSTRKTVTPVRGLKASDWVPLLHDTSTEMTIAVGLASTRARGKHRFGYLRRYLTPVEPDERVASWTNRPAPIPGLGKRPLQAVLAECLARQVIENSQHARGVGSKALGTLPVVGAGLRLRLGEAAFFFTGACDLDRVAELLGSLVLLDWSEWIDSPLSPPPANAPVIPTAFHVIAPFGHGRPIPRKSGHIELRMPTRWPSLLVANHVEEVCVEAIQRLRVARLAPSVQAPPIIAKGVNGAHLAAALLVPITDGAARSLLEQVVLESISVQ